MDPPCELSIMTFIRNKRRVWKSQLKRKHYDSHVTEEERLADRDPRVPKEQWRVLVAYWNTEKFKVVLCRILFLFVVTCVPPFQNRCSSLSNFISKSLSFYISDAI